VITGNLVIFFCSRASSEAAWFSTSGFATMWFGRTITCEYSGDRDWMNSKSNQNHDQKDLPMLFCCIEGGRVVSDDSVSFCFFSSKGTIINPFSRYIVTLCYSLSMFCHIRYALLTVIRVRGGWYALLLSFYDRLS
jgi:hypothetical protein